MMLPFKQPVLMDYNEAEALALAIYQWLEDQVAPGPAPGRRLTVVQVLSVRILQKLALRLMRKSMAVKQKPKRKPFLFNFSLEEMLAVRACITFRAGDFHLQKVLGSVNQKLLNYGQLIT
jgi:hypothetical protein